VLAAIVFAVAFIGGSPLTPLASPPSAGSRDAVFVFSSQRRYNRFTAFLDVAGQPRSPQLPDVPGDDRDRAGRTDRHRPGPGLNKLGDFLPLAHSDFIFAVIAEELGLVGVVAVIGGFLVLAYCGVQVALAASDRFGTLLAGGIVGWLTVQTLINVGGVTGLMPVTGLTLPFFSAGGSSLFVCMAASGAPAERCAPREVMRATTRSRRRSVATTGLCAT
jgi:cell division protein FtsW